MVEEVPECIVWNDDESRGVRCKLIAYLQVRVVVLNLDCLPTGGLPILHELDSNLHH